ncbi:MAG: nucleoside deaminase [Thermomicrobiales bacterium]
MDQALDLAESALNLGELPIAAIVVLNGEVLAQAHTAERSQKRLLVHAELLALEEADKLRPFPGNRSDVQLFTTLEPCLMCFGAAMPFLGLGDSLRARIGLGWRDQSHPVMAAR